MCATEWDLHVFPRYSLTITHYGPDGNQAGYVTSNDWRAGGGGWDMHTNADAVGFQPYRVEIGEGRSLDQLYYHWRADSPHEYHSLKIRYQGYSTSNDNRRPDAPVAPPTVTLDTCWGCTTPFNGMQPTTVSCGPHCVELTFVRPEGSNTIPTTAVTILSKWLPYEGGPPVYPPEQKVDTRLFSSRDHMDEMMYRCPFTSPVQPSGTWDCYKDTGGISIVLFPTDNKGGTCTLGNRQVQEWLGLASLKPFDSTGDCFRLGSAQGQIQPFGSCSLACPLGQVLRGNSFQCIDSQFSGAQHCAEGDIAWPTTEELYPGVNTIRFSFTQNPPFLGAVALHDPREVRDFKVCASYMLGTRLEQQCKSVASALGLLPSSEQSVDFDIPTALLGQQITLQASIPQILPSKFGPPFVRTVKAGQQTRDTGRAVQGAFARSHCLLMLLVFCVCVCCAIAAVAQTPPLLRTCQLLVHDSRLGEWRDTLSFFGAGAAGVIPRPYSYTFAADLSQPPGAPTLLALLVLSANGSDTAVQVPVGTSQILKHDYFPASDPEFATLRPLSTLTTPLPLSPSLEQLCADGYNHCFFVDFTANARAGTVQVVVAYDAETQSHFPLPRFIQPIPATQINFALTIGGLYTHACTRGG
jgi:hypothetical protein